MIDTDFMIDVHGVNDGIKVTAGAYQNAENKSDEEQTPMDRSPSSTVINAYRIQIEEVSPCSLNGNRGVVGADCYSVNSASNSAQPMRFGWMARETMGGQSRLREAGEFEVDGGSSTEHEGITPSGSPQMRALHTV